MSNIATDLMMTDLDTITTALRIQVAERGKAKITVTDPTKHAIGIAMVGRDTSYIWAVVGDGAMRCCDAAYETLDAALDNLTRYLIDDRIITPRIDPRDAGEEIKG